MSNDTPDKYFLEANARRRQLAEDRELCKDAIGAFPESEFANSCMAWVQNERTLTDKQKAALERIVEKEWGLDE